MIAAGQDSVTSRRMLTFLFRENWRVSSLSGGRTRPMLRVLLGVDRVNMNKPEDRQLEGTRDASPESLPSESESKKRPKAKLAPQLVEPKLPTPAGAMCQTIVQGDAPVDPSIPPSNGDIKDR